MNRIEIKAENTSAMRLDKFISENIEEITRSMAQRLIESGNVTVNGKQESKKYICKLQDKIIVNLPEPENANICPEEIPLDIVYEDDDIIIVNKPKGMVVHPAPGNYSGTLVNALLYHCGDRLSSINGIIRPGIVHRIDKDTSGLLVVAKNDFAHKILAEKIKIHDFKREYEARMKAKKTRAL